ncbi:MAG: tRNA-specific adenosine deaminase [Bacteroidetes bacterium]|jgi:tRNA(adenine34) deaminase|nr:tRNA-specific adenosine deaminase [Bacteroidota bacterium]
MLNGFPNTEHKTYMQEALKLANVALQNDEVPVGAVVVCNGRIVGKGYNQVEMLQDPTAHAEMVALSSACTTVGNKYLSGCTLYVTLEPCAMCAGAAVWSKLDQLVFGAMDEKAGAAGSVFNISSNNKLNHQVDVIQGVLEDECGLLLKNFFRKNR